MEVCAYHSLNEIELSKGIWWTGQEVLDWKEEWILEEKCVGWYPGMVGA